jgi:hypothetical protein
MWTSRIIKTCKCKQGEGDATSSTYIKIEHFTIYRVSNVKKFEKLKAGTIYYFITALLLCLSASTLSSAKFQMDNLKNIK